MSLFIQGMPLGLSAEEQQKWRLDQAKRDLDDIKILRESEAFNRYFMRRMKEAKDIAMHSYVYDVMEPSGREREITRNTILMIERMMDLLNTDEKARRDVVMSMISAQPLGGAGNG